MEEKKKKVETDSLLDIENLYVQYDTDDAVVHALNGLTLQVYRGEKVGLVGETGAGKTTMALSVLKLLPEKIGHITSGSICYAGDQLLDQKEAYMLGFRGKRVSMIFQDPMTSLNPVKTVGEQIIEVLNLHFPKMTKEEKQQRVDDILAMVGIPAERKKEFAHQFSGGMKQRIVIAMALIAQPELLLADEPTTALDVTIQAQIMKLLDEIRTSKNTSILLITHDLALVGENSDYVSVMYAGRIVETAPSKEFFANPKHPYSTALLRSLPANRGSRLETIQGQPPSIQQDITGCRFHPRCSKCIEICTNEVPQLDNVGINHYSACFRN